MATRKSNKMPADFKNRVSQGMKLHHRKKKITKAEQDIVYAAMRQLARRPSTRCFSRLLEEACTDLELARSS